MVLLNDPRSARDSDFLRGAGVSAAHATLAMDYADLNEAVARTGVTPATFRHIDLDANLVVSGVWADWVLLAGNRHNLEMRCPIIRGEASGVGAPRLDLSTHSVRIHVRLDKIPALAFPVSVPVSLPGAADPLVVRHADPTPPISVIATSCRTGLWRYKLPGLLESWFNLRLADLIDVFSVVLADEDDETQPSRRP